MERVDRLDLATRRVLEAAAVPDEPEQEARLAVVTAPGQTPGVSPFIDPVMADLGLSRSAVSTAYLIGTLLGAAAMPWGCW